MYCVVYRGKMVFTGTEADCYYYASGLPQNQVAVGTIEEYNQAIADLKSQPRRGFNPLRNIAHNTITHSSDDYMQRPMNYLKRRRRA